ncbi:hypothetical protein RFI_10960, partial [Reticulomyxa filosa]
ITNYKTSWSGSDGNDDNIIDNSKQYFADIEPCFDEEEAATWLENPPNDLKNDNQPILDDLPADVMQEIQNEIASGNFISSIPSLEDDNNVHSQINLQHNKKMANDNTGQVSTRPQHELP